MDTKRCNSPGDWKSLLRPLSLPQPQMAVLGAVVEAFVQPVIKTGGDIPLRCAVGAKLVCDDPSALEDFFKNDAVLINRPLKPV